MYALTKLIKVDIHLVRAAGVISLQDVPSHDQLADILTKPLSQQFFVRLKHKSGVEGGCWKSTYPQALNGTPPVNKATSPK